MGKEIVPASQDLERILVQRVLCGDPEAFYELVKPCQRMIMCAALSVLRNHADAEEVAQEALLKAMRDFAGFRRQSKFSTWVVQITINEARMRLRKYRPGSFVSLHTSLRTAEGRYVLSEYADGREIPFAAIERQELRTALRNAFDSLPPKYKEVLLLRDLNQLRTREAAFALGISEGNAKTRLSRARLMMRRALYLYDPSGCQSRWPQVGEPALEIPGRKSGLGGVPNSGFPRLRVSAPYGGTTLPLSSPNVRS